MDRRTSRSAEAFTLIELLVVVAIIALLISILLPSLSAAREQARMAKCGVQLRGFGTGLQIYYSENSDWIPGVNTSGLAARLANSRGDVEGLRSPSTPVQGWDWMTPSLQYNTELPYGRAQRWQFLQDYYSCPSFVGIKIDELYAPGVSASVDGSDFTPEIANRMVPTSYLMPGHFQYWGQGMKDVVFTTTIIGGRPFPVKPYVQSPSWNAVQFGSYRSRLDDIGIAARKIAAADGMRLLNEDKLVDIDVNPEATFFGSFGSNGAWWCGTQAYGVRQGSTNWDGSAVNGGPSNPLAGGEGLVWSYRHGAQAGRLVTTAQENKGLINALHFDGHVARYDDRGSREIDLWYPAGTRVREPANGMRDLPQDFEVP